MVINSDREFEGFEHVSPTQLFIDEICTRIWGNNPRKKVRVTRVRENVNTIYNEIKHRLPYYSYPMGIIKDRFVYELKIHKSSRIRLNKLLKTIFGNLPDKTSTSSVDGIIKIMGSSPENNFYLGIIQSTKHQLSIEEIHKEFISDTRKCLDIYLIDSINTIIRKPEEILGPNYVNSIEQARNINDVVLIDNSPGINNNQKEKLFDKTRNEVNDHDNVMGFILTGSTTNQLYIQLKEDHIGKPIKGRWGWLQVGHQRCLFYVEDCLLNGRSVISEDLPEDIQNFSDQFRLAAKVVTATPGNSLLSTPTSATQTYFLDPSRIVEFYNLSDPDTPINFLRSVDYKFKVPMDLKKLRQHGMLIAMTGAGKGYFSNAMLCAAKSKLFTADDGKKFPTGVLYIDPNGQWNQVGGKYGFFKPKGPFPSPQIYSLEEVNSPSFSDYVWDNFDFDDLPFSSTKRDIFRRRLTQFLDPSMSDFQFRDRLRQEIELIYATSVDDKIHQLELILSDPRYQSWDFICESYLRLIAENIPIGEVFSQLVEGNLVVIDASGLDKNLLYSSLYCFLNNIINMAKELWRERGMSDYCVPIITAIDEIHKYCPSPGSAKLTDDLRTIKEFILNWSRENRKYGTMLLGITQYPGQVEKSLLRNISLKIAGRLDEPSDRKKIEDNWNVELPLLPNYHFMIWKGGLSRFGNKMLIVKAMSPIEMENELNEQ